MVGKLLGIIGVLAVAGYAVYMIATSEGSPFLIGVGVLVLGSILVTYSKLSALENIWKRVVTLAFAGFSGWMLFQLLANGDLSIFYRIFIGAILGFFFAASVYAFIFPDKVRLDANAGDNGDGNGG